MKKAYVAYASSSELDTSKFLLPNVSFIFPLEKQNSKNIIKNCDALIADISRPSHGVGVEIGWADSFGIPIIFIYKRGSKISPSLKVVSKNFIEYNTVEDAMHRIEKIVGGLWKKK